MIDNGTTEKFVNFFSQTLVVFVQVKENTVYFFILKLIRDTLALHSRLKFR